MPVSQPGAAVPGTTAALVLNEFHWAYWTLGAQQWIITRSTDRKEGNQYTAVLIHGYVGFLGITVGMHFIGN